MNTPQKPIEHTHAVTMATTLNMTPLVSTPLCRFMPVLPANGPLFLKRQRVGGQKAHDEGLRNKGGGAGARSKNPRAVRKRQNTNQSSNPTKGNIGTTHVTYNPVTT